MSKHILAVDDSKTMRDMVSFTLSKAGFDVTVAEDGLQGTNKLDGGNYDCIITDINMPNMNGIEFLKNVRQHPKNRLTPVLILTTESGAELKTEGKQAGATGWIVKPFTPEKLIQVLNKVIR